MKRIASLRPSEREELFVNAAQRRGIRPAIVEKDFWVCFMLDHLFCECRWRDRFAFKGGTSLSKAYGAIERFSEDIDIILDWRLLGYSIEEPWQARSNSAQERFNSEAEARAAKFLQDEFIPQTAEALRDVLCDETALSISPTESTTVEMAYPRSFSATSILQVIRLEFGALAAWTPAEAREITPIAAEEYPKIFDMPTTVVRTVTAERTFWEKATILHREAHRQSGAMPARYSRHYYDLFRMAGSHIKDRALEDTDLLQTVVDFKMKFYRCPWAKYEEARRGTLILIPHAQHIDALKDDYRRMESMLFGDVPKFDEMIEGLARLEDEVNAI